MADLDDKAIQAIFDANLITEIRETVERMHPEDDSKTHTDDYWKGFETCKKRVVEHLNEYPKTPPGPGSQG